MRLILSRILAALRLSTSHQARLPPATYRLPKVASSAGHSRPVRLELLSDGKQLHPQARKLGLLTATLGTVVIAGFVAPAIARGDDEACAFVLQLRSPYTIERILRDFPNDPCVPVMISALAPELLRSISPALIAALPDRQLRLIPAEVLAQVPGFKTRSVTNPTPPHRQTTTTTKKRQAASPPPSTTSSPSSPPSSTPSSPPGQPSPTSPY